MPRRVLFIIASDPRTSARPAEAIRIAAGVGAWPGVEVRVYLRDAAVLVLGELSGALVDGQNFARYLPLIGEWGRPVQVQRGAPALVGLRHAPVPFEPIDDTELATLVAGATYTLRF